MPEFVNSFVAEAPGSAAIQVAIPLPRHHLFLSHQAEVEAFPRKNGKARNRVRVRSPHYLISYERKNVCAKIRERMRTRRQR
jgi:hypothetical protein